MFHISNHIDAKKNSLNSRECPNVKLNGWFEHKGHIYMTITKLYFYQNEHHQCSCKVHIGVATVDWSQPHPHMSSQHNKNMTTSHFDILFPHSNHFQIARPIQICLWVDIHVGLIFYSYYDCGWMSSVGFKVRKKLSTNQKWIAWEVRGLSEHCWKQCLGRAGI